MKKLETFKIYEIEGNVYDVTVVDIMAVSYLNEKKNFISIGPQTAEFILQMCWQNQKTVTIRIGSDIHKLLSLHYSQTNIVSVMWFLLSSSLHINVLQVHVNNLIYYQIPILKFNIYPRNASNRPFSKDFDSYLDTME